MLKHFEHTVQSVWVPTFKQNIVTVHLYMWGGGESTYESYIQFLLQYIFKIHFDQLQKEKRFLKEYQNWKQMEKKKVNILESMADQASGSDVWGRDSKLWRVGFRGNFYLARDKISSLVKTVFHLCTVIKFSTRISKCNLLRNYTEPSGISVNIHQTEKHV